MIFTVLFVRMPRRSPGQPKIRPKPTASDRARRQRTRKIRKMQATQVDTDQLQREKSNIAPDPVIVAGHSGDVNDVTEKPSNKISVEDYQKEVQLDGFDVSDTPNFLASDNENEDIDKVQGNYTINSDFKNQ